MYIKKVIYLTGKNEMSNIYNLTDFHLIIKFFDVSCFPNIMYIIYNVKLNCIHRV